MHKLDNKGAISGLAIAFGLLSVFFIAVAVFAGWAYSSRQDYKNNVQAKINVAVGLAKQSEDKLKDQQFAEAAKNPLRTYQGPSAYGSIVLNYPKTWSAYVDDSGQGSSLVDGYFNPSTVPSIVNQGNDFALRLQVLQSAYSQEVQSINNEVQQGQATVSAYSLPKVPNAVGIKFTGLLPNNQQKSGTMVVLPLRSDTLEIWTEGTQNLNDFNNYILPNISFSP